MNDSTHIKLIEPRFPQDPQQARRKPYGSPRLTQWGTIQEITRGGGPPNPEQGYGQFSTQSYAPRRRTPTPAL